MRKTYDRREQVVSSVTKLSSRLCDEVKKFYMRWFHDKMPDVAFKIELSGNDKAGCVFFLPTDNLFLMRILPLKGTLYV